LVRISDLSGGVVRYCVVRFDTALGKAKLSCVDNEDQAWKSMPSILRRPYALSYRIINNAGTPQPHHQRPSKT